MHQQSLAAVARKWWLILILAAVIGGLVLRLVASGLQPTYESTVRLLTGPISADAGTLEAAGGLARTYSELATSQRQLQSVARELKLNLSPDELQEVVKATSNDVSRVLTIRARQPTAEGARAVAERLGDSMVALSAEEPKRNAELAAALIREDAFSGFTAAQLSRMRLAAEKVLGERSPGSLTVVDPPRAATAPTSPRIGLLVLLGAIGGLAVAGTGIVVRERFFGTIDEPRDLTTVTGAPLLGAVDGGSVRSSLIIQTRPRSDAATRVRRLADQVGYLIRSGGAKSLVLLGQERGVPSGAVAANLAVALAELDVRVVVVDADPGQADATRLFGLSGKEGLAEVIRRPEPFGTGNATPLPLWITSGSDLSVVPTGAADGVLRHLDSSRVRHIVNDLKVKADIVLVVAPPLEHSSEALIWAEETDGTLIVAEQGTTTKADVERVDETIRGVGAMIVGSVFTGARWFPGVGLLRRLRRGRAAPSSRALRGTKVSSGAPRPPSFDGEASAPPDPEAVVSSAAAEAAVAPEAPEAAVAAERSGDLTGVEEAGVAGVPVAEPVDVSSEAPAEGVVAAERWGGPTRVEDSGVAEGPGDGPPSAGDRSEQPVGVSSEAPVEEPVGVSPEAPEVAVAAVRSGDRTEVEDSDLAETLEEIASPGDRVEEPAEEAVAVSPDEPEREVAADLTVVEEDGTVEAIEELASAGDRGEEPAGKAGVSSEAPSEEAVASSETPSEEPVGVPPAKAVASSEALVEESVGVLPDEPSEEAFASLGQGPAAKPSKPPARKSVRRRALASVGEPAEDPSEEAVASVDEPAEEPVDASPEEPEVEVAAGWSGDRTGVEDADVAEAIESLASAGDRAEEPAEEAVAAPEASVEESVGVSSEEPAEETDVSPEEAPAAKPSKRPAKKPVRRTT